MKKHFLFFGLITGLMLLWSCNDNRNQSGYGNGDSSMGNAGTGTDSMTPPTNLPPMSSNPLSKEDSAFVMEAAAGGMMEVEAGRIAQQNAANQRVKDFGGMMVADHGKANQDLMSLAASHGMTLPTTLPSAMQKHIDEMKNMKGKSFDQHYVSMMVTDHQEDLAKFKKTSAGAASEDLKTWATNAVPVLQKHLDSIQAIRKKI